MKVKGVNVPRMLVKNRVYKQNKLIKNHNQINISIKNKQCVYR